MLMLSRMSKETELVLVLFQSLTRLIQGHTSHTAEKRVGETFLPKVLEIPS